MCVYKYFYTQGKHPSNTRCRISISSGNLSQFITSLYNRKCWGSSSGHREMVSEESWYLQEEVAGARNAQCVGTYKRQSFPSLIFFKGKVTFKIKIIIQLTLEPCKGQGLQTAHAVGKLSITEDSLLHMWILNHKLNLEQYKFELLESTEKIYV